MIFQWRKSLTAQALILFWLAIFAFVDIRNANAQDKMSCVVGKNLIKVFHKPDGRVVSSLKKGTKVLWEDEIGGDGTSWAKIGVLRRGKYVSLGWVVFGYGSLKCNWP